MNLRDQNDRLIKENQKLLNQIKEVEAKEQSAETKGDDKLMQMLNKAAAGNTASLQEAKVADKSDDDQSESDSSTPESDGDGDEEADHNDNTVVMVDGPLEEEGLQIPVAHSNQDKAAAQNASQKNDIKTSNLQTHAAGAQASADS